jgi:hypothetical protein
VLEGVIASLVDAELAGGGGVVDPLPPPLLLEHAVSANAPAVPATSTSCFIIVVLPSSV